MIYDLFDDDLPSVVCEKCDSDDVTIETQVIHRSTDVKLVESNAYKYVTLNSDNSYDHLVDTEMFRCLSCDHRWKIDGKVCWEWID